MSNTPRFAPSLPWILFLMLMVFFGIFPRLLLSPMLLRISDGLSIEFDRASAFFLTASLGFVLGSLTSGFVSKWLSHRWTIVVSVTLGGSLMVVLSQVQSSGWFHVILFLQSWFNGLYPGSGIASVTALVPDDHRGKALALHESGPNLAFILAPILSALLAPVIGWRGVIAATGGAAVVAGVAYAFIGRGSTERGEPPHFENIKLFASNRSFWILTTFFVIAATAAIGVFSVLPTYLIVEHGYTERFVNTIVGASRITGFAALFLAGGLADRFGIRVVIAAIFAITGIVTIALGVAGGSLLLVAVFLQPLVVGSYFPVGLAALTTTAPRQARNLAVALAIPVANLIGAGVAPRVMAALGSAGSFRIGFVAVGAVAIASLALLPFLKIKPIDSPAGQA